MLGFESSDEDFSEESEPVGPLYDATRKGEMDMCKLGMATGQVEQLPIHQQRINE
jgi:hypothetical protein